MKWQMSFNEKENILFVKTLGVLDMETTKALIKECLEVIEQQNCRRCLVDNSEIESLNIGTIDIYSIPKLHAELGVPRNLRIAEVTSKNDERDFDFYETVCRNNGYSVSVYFDVESALQWLKQ
jgi:hypothetical protein